MTERFLSAIPARESLRRRITELWNYERFGLPRRVGAAFVYSKNTGLQNQSVVYTAAALDGPARVLIDPNTLSEDGTVALSGMSFSDDGRYVAYATSASGSDWLIWRIRDVASGIDLDDVVQWSKFSSASWLLDGSGFYLQPVSPHPDEIDAIQRRQLQSSIVPSIVSARAQTDDELIYERPDHPDWNITG